VAIEQWVDEVLFKIIDTIYFLLLSQSKENIKNKNTN
jgi:hypothetical protein